MKQFIRTGAYALIIQDAKILLARQKGGPSVGLWHLPGGGIEFSESPLQALHRELLEEAALKIFSPRFLTVLSYHGEHPGSEPYRYHYIGLVYRVEEILPTEDNPEDETGWFPLETLDLNQATAFVRQLHEQKYI